MNFKKGAVLLASVLALNLCTVQAAGNTAPVADDETTITGDNITPAPDGETTITDDNTGFIEEDSEYLDLENEIQDELTPSSLDTAGLISPSGLGYSFNTFSFTVNPPSFSLDLQTAMIIASNIGGAWHIVLDTDQDTLTFTQPVTVNIGQDVEITLMRVDGQPLTIFSGGSNRHFQFNINDNATMTFQTDNITLDGCGAGGGIVKSAYTTANAGTFILKNANVQNCYAANGGGLYSLGPLTIRESYFSHNTASANGGGIYLDNQNTQVDIVGSTLSYNNAGNGGGVFIADPVQLIILFTTFQHNLASKGYDVALPPPNLLHISGSAPFYHVLNNYDVYYSPSTESPVYTAVFKMNDGAYDEAARVRLENSGPLGAAFPPAPTRDGYSFTGWNTRKDGLGADITAATPISNTENVILYAQWNPMNYTSPEAPQALTAIPGNGQITLSWNTPADDGGKPITKYEISTDGGATWPFETTNTSYTVTGLSNGQSYTFHLRAVNGVGAGAAVAITASPTAGSGGSNSGNSRSRSQQNTAASEYVIQFITNGGNSVTRIVVKANGTPQRPDDPVREGFLFTGWYKDPSLTELFDFNAKVEESVTLYAGWRPVPPSGPAEPEPPVYSPYISGYSAGAFRPDASISRGEAAQLLYNLMENGLLPYHTGENDILFSDVSEQDWYYGAISALAGTGAVSGYPDGTCKPEAALTRAEFSAMVASLLELDANGTGTFPDVPEGHWASSAIAAMEEAGYIGGYPDGSFGPEDAVTRAQAVTILNNVLSRDTAAASFEGLAMPFSDVPQSHWAYNEIMAAAVEQQIADAR